MIYIVTSKKKKKVIAESDYLKIAEFIKKNQDARIRTLDYTAKPRIMNRQKFLRLFLEATGNQIEFFALTEILVPSYTNFVNFISFMGLLKEYNQFRKTI